MVSHNKELRAAGLAPASTDPRAVTDRRMRADNLAFAGTAGVSEHARKARFMPAFKDLATGRVEIACFTPGQPAPMHVLSCLPDEWAAERNADGDITVLIPSVIAGFVRDERFYTREEAAAAAD
ncbi:MAG: hypothetical protein ACKOBM_15015 [Gammaproteobacteria bacterium]|jgi:hypothetical protein